MEKYLIIPSETKSLNKLEGFLDNFFEENKLRRDKFYQVLLVLTESVNNSIKHGNCYNSEKSVIICLSWEQKILEILVEDEGDGFDTSQIDDPTLSGNIKNESGRGLFLINQLADDVDMIDNGRKIIMKFNTNREHLFL